MKKLIAFLCLALACLIPGMASAANHLNSEGVLIDSTGSIVLALYGFTTGTPHKNNFGYLIDDTGALVVTGISSGSGDALTTDPLSQFAATTSAQFLGVISNETGSGLVVGNNTPTLIAPVLGAATGTSVVLSDTAANTDLSVANTTAASSGTSQGAPIFSLNGTYWTGSASAVASLKSTMLPANGTNGRLTQTWTTGGSTGGAIWQFDETNNSADISQMNWKQSGTSLLNLQYGSSSVVQFGTVAAGSTLALFGRAQATANTPSVKLGNGTNTITTSGTSIEVQVSPTSSFGPASGSAKFIALGITPTINQTGSASGDYTALDVNVTETAVTGTNKLLADFRVGNTSKASIDDTGKMKLSGTAATWSSGTGSPESAVTAPVGSIFTRTDGGANTTLYVKESGSSNTGWIAK